MKTASSQTKGINWGKISRYELEQISEIVQRALPLYEEFGLDDSPLAITMDISGAHIVCPIKLSKLATADEETFAHDVFGIRRHFNRRTFTIENCFLPRTAVTTNHDEHAD